jgi:AcrR family transcriptional regulator
MYASAENEPAALGIDRIVAAAVELIEADGIGSMTMRRLAKELGCSPMALYRHVADKQQLIAAVADHYLADLELPDVDGLPWQEAIVTTVMAVQQAFTDRPRLEEMLAFRHVDTIAIFRADETILRVLRDAGFDGRDAVHAVDVIASYAVGATLRQASVRRDGAAEDTRLGRLRQLPAEEFPVVRELAGELVTVDFHHTFEDGLRLLIDGLERRLMRKTG